MTPGVPRMCNEGGLAVVAPEGRVDLRRMSLAILRQRGHVDPRRLQLRIHLILLRQPRPSKQGVVCDEVLALPLGSQSRTSGVDRDAAKYRPILVHESNLTVVPDQ